MADLLVFVLWIEWCIVVLGVGVFEYTPLQSFSWKLGILGFGFFVGAWGLGLSFLDFGVVNWVGMGHCGDFSFCCSYILGLLMVTSNVRFPLFIWVLGFYDLWLFGGS